MLIPTLQATKFSRGRGDITEADEKYVLRAIREIVEDLGHRPESTERCRSEPPEGTVTGSDRENPWAIRVLGCPAHDAADQSGARDAQKPARPVALELGGDSRPETLTAELLDEWPSKQPDLRLPHGDPTGRAGTYPLSVQATTRPVSGPQDSRLPLGPALPLISPPWGTWSRPAPMRLRLHCWKHASSSPACGRS